MVIKKLKPGMIVYDIRPTRGLDKFNGKWSTYTVKVIEIDEENNRVLASWNGNKAEWYHQNTWSKWRLSRPKGK